MRGNTAPALVRTIVPVVVGWLIALGLRAGLDLDPDHLTGIVEPVTIAAYYALVRFLEGLHPAFGWLLGLANQPSYDQGSDTSLNAEEPYEDDLPSQADTPTPDKLGLPYVGRHRAE